MQRSNWLADGIEALSLSDKGQKHWWKKRWWEMRKALSPYEAEEGITQSCSVNGTAWAWHSCRAEFWGQAFTKSHRSNYTVLISTKTWSMMHQAQIIGNKISLPLSLLMSKIKIIASLLLTGNLATLCCLGWGIIVTEREVSAPPPTFQHLPGKGRNSEKVPQVSGIQV